jgi:hypothetical protein
VAYAQRNGPLVDHLQKDNEHYPQSHYGQPTQTLAQRNSECPKKKPDYKVGEVLLAPANFVEESAHGSSLS